MKLIDYIRTLLNNEVLLYKNDDFIIYNNSNDCFSYHTEEPYTEMSPIYAIGKLLRDKSIHLSDPKLREIEIPAKRKESDLGCLDNYKNYNRINIINNQNGEINCFFDYDFIDDVPSKIYMKLVDKYYPILIDIIKKSNTLGDIIDYHTVVYQNITADIDFELSVSKYNL